MSYGVAKSKCITGSSSVVRPAFVAARRRGPFRRRWPPACCQNPAVGVHGSRGDAPLPSRLPKPSLAGTCCDLAGGFRPSPPINDPVAFSITCLTPGHTALHWAETDGLAHIDQPSSSSRTWIGFPLTSFAPRLHAPGEVQ